MKNKILASLLTVAAMGGANQAALAGDMSYVKIPLEGVMTPRVGFDDNDRVVAVAYGNLPNACYTVGPTKVVKSGAGTFKVVQFAMKKNHGICSEEDNMPEHLKMRVPFSTEVKLGTLSAGTFKLEYDRGSHVQGLRVLEVSKSNIPSIDSLPYAIVTNASVVDVSSAKEEVSVTLSGVLNSTCTVLDKDVRVQKVDDVYVLFPTTHVIPGMCAQALVPYSTTVKLGKLDAGKYLVHVRSQQGNAVNRAFEVIP